MLFDFAVVDFLFGVVADDVPAECFLCVYARLVFPITVECVTDAGVTRII
jgi:hypothetical protein